MGGDGLCRRQEKEVGQEGEEEAGGQHRARALQLQGELNRHTSVETKERKGKELSEKNCRFPAKSPDPVTTFLYLN